ncbi:MAG: glycosyltransferase [Microthrixaceae bacterium]
MSVQQGDHRVDPPTPLPNVGVVVLNWNAAWLTARCVRSLRASTYPSPRLRILIVDNASIDGSVPRLRHDLGRVEVLVNEANVGFAEGINRGIRALWDDCDAIALVNNDAVVEPGWLEPLVAALQGDPRLAAAAPKILLEQAFASFGLTGHGVVESITVDGADVTRKVVLDGVRAQAHPTEPFQMLRLVEGAATVAVPVGTACPSTVPETVTVELEWSPAPAGPADLEVVEVKGSCRVLDHGAGGIRLELGQLGTEAHERINSVGIELTPQCEGSERHFGRVDRHFDATEVWGFSGGGVLLRTEALRKVGLFDPRWFAYYEDVDLSWRLRRAGWTVRCEPESVLRHLHGGSAGPEAAGFFLLNYRNWLLTVLRNGTARQRTAALGLARRHAWGSFRRNVFGRARRGQRIDARLTRAWSGVLAATVSAAPKVRRRGRENRSGTPVGVVAVSGDAAGPPRLMAPTPPRAPRPRPGGPTLVYMDVTETLRSGWRAGIQRVVCELARGLPEARADLELVPIRWSELHDRFRRLDNDEYAALLAPTADQQPTPRPAPPSVPRRVVGAVARGLGVAGVVRAVRRRRALASEPACHKTLLLDRLEAGSVFLDVDASWNLSTVERHELLPALVAAGIRTVRVQYDLIPLTHPQWFVGDLPTYFARHLDAHLGAGSTFVCISEHTRAELLAHCRRGGLTAPRAEVVPLGADPFHAGAVDTRPVDGDRVAGSREIPPDAPWADASRVFLMIGTVEPRKGHDTAIAAFGRVRSAHPDTALVVVGRAGWHHGDLIDRLRRGIDGVYWYENVSDVGLDEFYRGGRGRRRVGHRGLRTPGGRGVAPPRPGDLLVGRGARRGRWITGGVLRTG